MTVESQLQTLLDRAAIVELRHEYAHCIDRCEWDRWAELFCEDAHVTYEGRPDLKGRDEIREFGASVLNREYAFTYHEALLPVVLVDGDTATGEWYLRLYYAGCEGGAGLRLGRYSDEYRRTEEGWKFAAVSTEICAHTGSTFDYAVVPDGHYEKDLVEFETW